MVLQEQKVSEGSSLIPELYELLTAFCRKLVSGLALVDPHGVREQFGYDVLSLLGAGDGIHFRGVDMKYVFLRKEIVEQGLN